MMAKSSSLAIKSDLIVVVDDDAAVRKSLKFSLEVDGFLVRTYERSEELLSESVFPACHCLVIDQKLPGLSGIDLIAKLREREVSVPAILITTDPSPALKMRARSAGIPIIEKPLLGSALLDCIHQTMTQSASPSN